MTKPNDPVQEQLIAARRNQILDAATTVFAAKGFHRATIRDVAHEAGVADGTIYNYFKDKTDLIIGLMDRLNETEERSGQFQEGMDADLRTFFVTYMRHRIDVLWPNIEVFQAILPELVANPQLREIYFNQVVAPTTQLGEQFLTAMIDAGKINTVDVSLTIRTIAGSFLGLLLMQVLGDDYIKDNWERLPDVLADLLFDGLNPKE